MNTKFVGDIHGDEHWDYSYIKNNLLLPNSIQIGDLDLGGYDKFEFSTPRFFIDGNHDNFQLLNCDADIPQEIVPGLHYIPRGFVSGKTLFIGGGYSIDKDTRTPGFSWYPEEELSQRQFYKIMDIDKSIDIVVAHDCPVFAYKPFFNINNNGEQTHSFCLNSIFEKFQPKLWIFGHHHRPVDMTLFNCRFVCLGIGQIKEFDIDHKLF